MPGILRMYHLVIWSSLLHSPEWPSTLPVVYYSLKLMEILLQLGTSIMVLGHWYL